MLNWYVALGKFSLSISKLTTYSFFDMVPSDNLISIFGKSRQSEPGAKGICCILACTRGLMSLQM